MQAFLTSLVVIIALSGYIYFFDEEAYNILVQEDGIVESLTALTLLIMSILVLIRVFRSKRSTPWKAFHILMALAFFFGFGEEISWGQRLLSIESSDFFLKYNSQSETNLHNLEIRGVKINKLIFSLVFTIIFTIYFIFFGLFYRKWNWFKVQVDKFGVPIPKLSQTIVLAVVTALIMAIPSSKRWELWEAVFVLVLFMVILNPYNSREKLFPLGSDARAPQLP